MFGADGVLPESSNSTPTDDGPRRQRRLAAAAQSSCSTLQSAALSYKQIAQRCLHTLYEIHRVNCV